MSKIVSATAFANNEIAVIAWTLKVAIPDCMGFEVTRIYTDTGQEAGASGVGAFRGTEESGLEAADH